MTVSVGESFWSQLPTWFNTIMLDFNEQCVGLFYTEHSHVCGQSHIHTHILYIYSLETALFSLFFIPAISIICYFWLTEEYVSGYTLYTILISGELLYYSKQWSTKNKIKKTDIISLTKAFWLLSFIPLSFQQEMKTSCDIRRYFLFFFSLWSDLAL